MTRLIGLACLLLTIGFPVAADPRIERTIAAIEIGEAGVRTGNVGWVITAVEMLADLAPSGPAAEALMSDFISEASFLMRATPELSARLVDAELRARDPDPTLVIETAQILPRALPEGQGITGLGLVRGVLIEPLLGGDIGACARQRGGRIWTCDPQLARGELVLATQGTVDEALLVLTSNEPLTE